MESEGIFFICVAVVLSVTAYSMNMGPPNIGRQLETVIYACHQQSLSDANCKEAIDKVKGNDNVKQ